MLYPQKPLVFATKTPLIRTTFYCPQKPPFYVQKAFYLHKSFLAGFKKRPFSQTKSLAFTQTFSYSHPKHSFFARCPFQPPLTYCPQKFPIFTNQKPFIRTNLFYCHPKQTFSALRCPFQRPLTYCLQRIQPFFCSSL